MQLIKADTLTKVVIGPVVAVGDGFTPVTTLALTTADEAELFKHDAAAVTDISTNTFAAITGADGYYNLTITAAQLDTEGRLTVIVNDDSLCLPVRHDFMVVNANVYDSLYGAATTDYLQVDTVQVSGAAQTANDNGADINALITSIGVAGAGLTNLGGSGNNWNVGKTGYSLTVAPPTAAAIVNALLDEAISGHLTAGTVGLYLAIAGGVLVDATATGTPTTTEVKFTGGIDSLDFYQDQLVWVIYGTGVGQVKPIINSSYLTGTTTLTLAATDPFKIAPVATDRIVIQAAHVHTVDQIQNGLAKATALQVVDDEIATINGKIIGTLAAGTHNPATAAQIAVLSDWIDAGRLDVILDAIAADVASGGIVKNATFSNFPFPMVLTSDHYTAATGKTVTGEMRIDNAAFVAINGVITEVSDGMYECDLTADDTNGDVITYKFSSATCDDTIITVTTRA